MSVTTAPPTEKLRGARLATSAVFLSNGFAIGNWAAQIPRFKVALGIGDAALSLVLLSFALGAILAMPLTGWATTRAGSRRATLAVGLAYAVLLSPPGLASSLGALAFTALLAGAANGAMDVAMNTYATAIEKAWGRPIMSSFHGFWSLGGLAGAAFSSLMIGAGFGVFPILAMAAAFIAFVMLAAARPLAVPISGAEAGHGFAWPSAAVLAIGILTFLSMVSEGAMVDWSAVYLHDVGGASLSVAAAGYAAFSLAMTACRFAGDGIVRRLGPARTLKAGALVAAAGFALATALPSPPTAATGFALVGLGLANAVPVLFTAAGRAGALAPGVGVAMVSTVGYAGFLLGPPVIGGVADLFGLRLALAMLVASALAIAVFAGRAARA